MRKTVLLAAMLSLTVLMFAASPAMAQDWNDGWWNDDWNNDWNAGWWNDGFDFDDGLNQDVEQEAESGDVDQSFDVSQTGDNSNQTAGIQGVANTGNAQNQIGVVDAGGFDGNDFFDNGDEFCDEFDEFCEDLEEFCEDFDGDGFCDDFFDDGNRFFGDDDGDFGFDNVGSSIEVSPVNTTSSDQEVNQAASASGR